MMMKDWTSWDIQKAIEQHETFALYLYTPMCGTCQVAAKMLSVVKEIRKVTAFAQTNVNYAQETVLQHQIESVPCLLLFKRGIMVKKLYAFQSVPYLNELISRHLGGNE